MKRFIAITAIVTSALGMLSCEKHSWENETKKLYQHGDQSCDGGEECDKEEKKPE